MIQKIILYIAFGSNLFFSAAWSSSMNKVSGYLSEIKEHLEQELKPIVPNGAGGIVGLIKDGEESEFITLGQLAVENNTSVNKNTLTLVGSTSKMFVGLLSVHLAELGILSLDTELSEVMDKDHMSIFDDQELAKHITLRQMLSHTSGLQYDTDCDRNERAEENLERILDEMVHEVQDNPAQKIKFTNYPRDKIYSYSNQIWIATVFIEHAYNRYLQSKDGKVHHLSYADILEYELLKPLEMTRTGFQKSTNDPFTKDPNKMLAYVEQREEKAAYSYELYTLDPLHRAVGGLWTTAADLIKLASAFTPNGLITKSGSVLISKPYLDELIQIQGINGNVGLGVYHEQDRIGKGGSLSSYGSNFEIDLATGNAVVSLINFRPTIPVSFDSRALLALEEMGSAPRQSVTLSHEIKEELRKIKKYYQTWTMADYDSIYTSKFGYIGVHSVTDGIIMNWNGNTLVAGKVADNRFMIFDDEYRDGTQVLFGIGHSSHLPYVFFENGNDNSQAFKVISKEKTLPEDAAEAVILLKNIHGVKGKIYTGTRSDGAGSITLKWNEQIKQITAQCEGNEVPIFITKIIRNNSGLINLNSAVESTTDGYCTDSSGFFADFLSHRMGDTPSIKNQQKNLNNQHISHPRYDSTAEFRINEVWFMGNHFAVPDKLTKLIRKDNNNWVLAIAIFDNPEKNVEYLEYTQESNAITLHQLWDLIHENSLHLPYN